MEVWLPQFHSENTGVIFCNVTKHSSFEILELLNFRSTIMGFSHASRGMQKCFVAVHCHWETTDLCLVQIKYLLWHYWKIPMVDIVLYLGICFYYYLVLDTMWKCPDCKTRDFWENGRSSDYPLPCMCQRRHHILWCFKRWHLRLERTHLGPNDSRSTQCEYCHVGLWGGALGKLRPHFSMFLPFALQLEDFTKQL